LNRRRLVSDQRRFELCHSLAPDEGLETGTLAPKRGLVVPKHLRQLAGVLRYTNTGGDNDSFFPYFTA